VLQYFKEFSELPTAENLDIFNKIINGPKKDLSMLLGHDDCFDKLIHDRLKEDE